MPFPFAPTEPPAELTLEEREIVAPLLESHGYRGLAAAHVFGAGLRLAPTLDDKMLLAEEAAKELGHFEAAAALYDQIGAGDLLTVVDKRVTEVPLPSTWLELAVMRFLFDRAGKFQLREYLASRHLPCAVAVTQILAEGEAHQSAGEGILRDLCGGGTERGAKAQAHFDHWLRILLHSFGRPGTWQGAVDLGPKSRDSARVIRSFLLELTPALSACALRMPSSQELELDLPEGALAE